MLRLGQESVERWRSSFGVFKKCLSFEARLSAAQQQMLALRLSCARLDARVCEAVAVRHTVFGMTDGHVASWRCTVGGVVSGSEDPSWVTVVGSPGCVANFVMQRISVARYPGSAIERNDSTDGT